MTPGSEATPQPTETRAGCSPELFPGTQPGQPLHVYSARHMLHVIGIPTRAARIGTWLQLVREAPPSVLADALGVHPNTAMRYANLAGADFLGYPALTPILARLLGGGDWRRSRARCGRILLSCNEFFWSVIDYPATAGGRTRCLRCCSLRGELRT